jgi:hypothetical protein
MKKMMTTAAAVVAFAAMSVQAAEVKFGDLNYFLKTGQFIASAEANHNSYQEKSDGDEAETEGYYSNFRLNYGLADKINLFLGVGYNWKAKVAEGSAASYRQDGFTNPYAGGTYRFMNQNNGGVNVDFGALVRVNLQDQELGSSSPKKDGNAAIGRNSFELNAAIGKKWDEANEWRLSGGVVYNAAGEFDQLGATKVTIDTESSVDVFLRAAYQYRPVNEFFMEFFALANRFGEQENKPDGDKETLESRMDYRFGFVAKYLITSNVIGRFNYGQSLLPDYDVDTQAGDYKVNRRRESSWGLGVDWLF